MEALKQLIQSVVVGSQQQQQQQQQQGDESKSNDSVGIVVPYMMIFQYGCSLNQRVMAASTTTSTTSSNISSSKDEDKEVYALAGIATPSQCANYELQLYPQIMSYMMSQTCLADDNTTILLSVSCLGPSPYKQQQQQQAHSMEIDFYSDPCGWEEDTTTNKTTTSTKGSIHRLSHVWKTLQQAVQQLQLQQQQQQQQQHGSDGVIVMIWDSLTPLIQLHGMKKVIRLLQQLKQRLPVTMIILPVQSSCLSTQDNFLLEDVSDALLSSSSSSAILYRPTSITQHFQHPSSRLSLRGGMAKFTQHTLSTPHPTPPKQQQQQQPETPIPTYTPSTNDIHHHPKKSVASTNRLVLSHEPDHHRQENPPSKSSSQNQTQSPPPPPPQQQQQQQQPMIYMEDDDPEFEDFDDEDIDDDLDI